MPSRHRREVDVQLNAYSTPALKTGVGDQCHTLATLGPEKKQQDTSYRRLIGPWGQSGWVQKISPPPGFESWNVQPVACHYATYTVLATITQHIVEEFKRRLSPFSPIMFIKLVHNFHIIYSMHCVWNYLHTPAFAHKVISYI